MSGGLIYTAIARNIAIPVTSGQLWEIAAAPGTSILIRSISISFIPQISSNIVSVTSIAGIQVATLSSLGSGGTPVLPVATDRRNTLAAQTTINSLVTTPGPVLAVLTASNTRADIKDEYQALRHFGPWHVDALPVSGGGIIGVLITGDLSNPFSVTSTIEIEEI